jgi:hypothetical protein
MCRYTCNVTIFYLCKRIDLSTVQINLCISTRYWEPSRYADRHNIYADKNWYMWNHLFSSPLSITICVDGQQQICPAFCFCHTSLLLLAWCLLPTAIAAIAVSVTATATAFATATTTIFRYCHYSCHRCHYFHHCCLCYWQHHYPPAPDGHYHDLHHRTSRRRRQ